MTQMVKILHYIEIPYFEFRAFPFDATGAKKYSIHENYTTQLSALQPHSSIKYQQRSNSLVVATARNGPRVLTDASCLAITYCQFALRLQCLADGRGLG